MEIGCWLHAWGEARGGSINAFAQELTKHGIKPTQFNKENPTGPGVCIFTNITPDLGNFLRTASRGGHERVIAIARPEVLPDRQNGWELLKAGASDVLAWSDLDQVVRQVRARFERWGSVEQLLDGADVANIVIAKSAVLRATLRSIIEIARFSEASVLILGESGTGKEVVARLIHQLDSRLNKRDLVVLDCSTVVAELSGSEFFGHERGAFTGALTERHGAFSLANGGSLFLDEIGELSLPLQAQLLRVVQERTYKRVGGSTWQRTAFRLICATNRDLLDMVRLGKFRADLYHRIASHVCKLPPLRERPEDVMPLAEFFFRQIHPDHKMPELDARVRDYLLRREYPGNVRDLQQVVSRLMHRCAADGTITIGCVPSDEREDLEPEQRVWLDSNFERMVHRAVLCGAGLKEISRAAEAVAIRFASEEEDGSLQRAAHRLRVTARTLQLRRANSRSTMPVGN